ncbi:MAG: preprotein translocase subunit SecG [Zoogloeaceae bacterium]|nr:preprotein translocase subunit SecG [Zoogloeaceae bacterium]
MTNWFFSLLLSVHILLALGVIWLVLMQHGKGADMGAAFGSGASGSLFGASGSANFLSRSTAVLATLFFLTSLGLTYVASNAPKTSGSLMQDTVQSPPVLPGDAEAQAPQAAQEEAREGTDATGEETSPRSDRKVEDIPR